MAAGCTNPGAVNYNPAADPEDYSCLYLIKANGNCHLFRDVTPDNIIDKSFTLSYSVTGNGWVFFHDYLPDFYIHTRNKLYSIKDNKMRLHNEGPYGVFDGNTPKPFFIDIIFASDSDLLLESIAWITEVLNAERTEQHFNTLTHISIWNSYQHSGRITLSQVFENLEYNNIRKTKGEWSFNDFRDVLKEDPGDFLQSIFNNYQVDPAKIDPDPVWYNQMPLQDKWFCVRLEFDNIANNQIVLHDSSVQALKQDR